MRARLISPNAGASRPVTAGTGMNGAPRIVQHKPDKAQLSAMDRWEKLQVKIAIRDSKIEAANRENTFANSGAG